MGMSMSMSMSMDYEARRRKGVDMAIASPPCFPLLPWVRRRLPPCLGSINQLAQISVRIDAVKSPLPSFPPYLPTGADDWTDAPTQQPLAQFPPSRALRIACAPALLTCSLSPALALCQHCSLPQTCVCLVCLRQPVSTRVTSRLLPRSLPISHFPFPKSSPGSSWPPLFPSARSALLRRRRRCLFPLKLLLGALVLAPRGLGPKYP